MLKAGLNSTEPTSSQCTSFLGITLDSNLFWKQHVATVAGKLAQFCYALRTLSGQADLQTCFLAYYAYVYSRLRYGIVIWGNSVEANFILQKRAVRSMFNMNVRETCKPVFKNTEYLPSIQYMFTNV